MFWLLVFIAVIVLIYWKFKKSLEQGKLEGVKYVPLFDRPGDVLNPIFYTDRLLYLYNKNPKDRYTGIYQSFRPVLMIKDLDLLQTVMVKDFEHFTDHTPIFVDADHDPLWSKNLVALEGQKWKNMRTTLSPAFTSSKMRTMFQLMAECSEQFTKHFENEKSDVINVNLKEIFTRYSTDIIGSCAFGIQTNSMDDKENDFFLMGQEFSNLQGFKTVLKLILMIAAPSIAKILKISFFGKFLDFFLKLVGDTIAIREEKKIYRPDMIHLLMEAQKGKLKYEDDSIAVGFAAVSESNVGIPKEPIKQEITLLDITSQAFLFFLGGFDSVSTMVSYMAYELALATEVQEKLFIEIDEMVEECGGKVSYDVLNRMKYMDMVISETLRKYPMSTVTDRICTKDYTIPPDREGEAEIKINPGKIIIIPIWAIHHNPEYYPNPFKFDPERFNDENKHNIKPFMYLPFGSGPRNCIGSRFALLETKVLFFHLLHKFEIVPNKNTPVPLKFRKDVFQITAKDKLFVDLRRRTH